MREQFEQHWTDAELPGAHQVYQEQGLSVCWCNAERAPVLATYTSSAQFAV